MEEKKKTSSSKGKSTTAKKAAPKKKTTNTKKTTTNSTKKQTNKSVTTGKKEPVKTTKKDPKEDTKKIAPVIKAVEKKNKSEEPSNTKSSESAKVENQIKKRFAGQSDEMSKLIKIVLIVTAIMIVFYGITVLVTKKADDVKSTNKDSNSETAETTIQYDNIMIGTMLNKGGSYYVLIKADGDNRTAEYDTLIQTIEASEDAPTIYKANLTDAFNKDYLAKEENYYVSDIAEFKVTGTTLVKVSDGKVENVYDNYDKIKNQLNELS